jgi:hypothetical protein
MSGILLAAGYLFLLLWWIRRSRFFTLPCLPKRHLAGLFLLKVLAGTALWWIYTYHYTDRPNADVYKYFDSSKPMYDALWSRPQDFFRMLFGIGNDTPYFTETYYMKMDHWFRKYESNLYNDSHTMIRFNAVVRIFSGGHIHVHTVFAAFLAFTGMTALARAFVRHPAGSRACALCGRLPDPLGALLGERCDQGKPAVLRPGHHALEAVPVDRGTVLRDGHRGAPILPAAALLPQILCAHEHVAGDRGAGVVPAQTRRDRVEVRHHNGALHRGRPEHAASDQGLRHHLHPVVEAPGLHRPCHIGEQRELRSSRRGSTRASGAFCSSHPTPSASPWSVH